jgi:hypothetical protein
MRNNYYYSSMYILNKIRSMEFEAFIWISALIYLILIDPNASNHLNFCFFSLIGVEYCPGCGLGRSISMILHGYVLSSFQIHPLGFFAIVIIVLRITKLLNKSTILPKKIEV